MLSAHHVATFASDFIPWTQNGGIGLEYIQFKFFTMARKHLHICSGKLDNLLIFILVNWYFRNLQRRCLPYKLLKQKSFTDTKKVRAGIIYVLKCSLFCNVLFTITSFLIHVIFLTRRGTMHFLSDINFMCYKVREVVTNGTLFFTLLLQCFVEKYAKLIGYARTLGIQLAGDISFKHDFLADIGLEW